MAVWFHIDAKRLYYLLSYIDFLIYALYIILVSVHISSQK